MKFIDSPKINANNVNCVFVLLSIFSMLILACSVKTTSDVLVKKGNQTTSTAAYSAIWGVNGKKWDKTRIPDFRTAGYKKGTMPLPNFSSWLNIKDYGAKGDGATDDTRALKAAIKACQTNQGVYLPAGTYLISDSIIVKKNNFAIRGDGSGSSFIYFSKGLEELYPLYNANYPNQSDWSWSGGMLLFYGDISNFGVQDLSIKFPDSTWAGHNFHERGYNAIGFQNKAHDGWVKNVDIIGADLGIWVAEDAHHMTIDNWKLKLGPIRGAQAINGHHGVNIYGGHNLLQNFTIEGKYLHDISVESKASIFNVFRAGSGKDICIDHHNHDSNHNLFTNIDAGLGTRLFTSGGKAKPAGICFNETFWNIRAVNNLPYCDKHDDATKQSLNNVCVGFKTDLPSSLGITNRNWFESISSDLLIPKDLYQAQLNYSN